MAKEPMVFLADTDADEDDIHDNFVQVSVENPLPCTLVLGPPVLPAPGG